MNDLVERCCEVVTTDNAVIFNPHSNLSDDSQYHPIICGKPAYDFVDYCGGHRVWMCIEHWILATNGGQQGGCDFQADEWRENMP